MYKNKIIDLMLPCGLGIITILFALILKKGYASLGFELLISGLLLTVSLIIGNAALVILFLRSKVIKEVKDEICVLRQSVQPKEFPWLRPLAALDAIERTTEGPEIWIVTPDLKNDTGGAPIIPVLKDNASRGILYTYIAPDIETVRGRVS